MAFLQLHTRLGNVTIPSFILVIALWALLNFARKQGLSPSYWGALVVGEVLLAVQGFLGLLIYLQGNRPPRVVHYLYGVFILLVWPGLFAYTQGQDTRREALLYGLVSLFLFGVSLRAIGTGQ